MIGGKGEEVSAVVERTVSVPNAYTSGITSQLRRIRVVQPGRMMKKLERNQAELWIGASPLNVVVNLADEGSTWCYGWEGEAVDALKAALTMEAT